METTKYFWTVESELIICIQLVVNVLLLFTPLNRYMMTSLGPVIHIWPLAKHRITYLINILLIRNNLIGGGGVKKEFQHSPQNQSISRFDNFSSYLMINTNEPKSTYVSDSFTNRSIIKWLNDWQLFPRRRATNIFPEIFHFSCWLYF